MRARTGVPPPKKMAIIRIDITWYIPGSLLTEGRSKHYKRLGLPNLLRAHDTEKQ